MPELVDALRLRQILEPVLAEILGLGGDEIARRPREKDLTAVTCSCDSRRSMDVEADVVPAGQGRLAGVQAHPDANRPLRERSLSFARGSDRVGGTRERDEERVALRVHLDPAVRGEGLAEHPSVLGECLDVGGAELP